MSRRQALTSNGTDPTTDICPVCKSNRYLNPSLTFLINPECYHTMCTSCVDRLFTSGPAPCPVAGCHKTLRKKNFHPPFFADLAVEREVDVRRRVGAVFNRRQEEFETLRDWNDYLELIEGLVFDIVEGTDIERKKAEERLKLYADEYKEEIRENARVEKEEDEFVKRRQAAEADGARRRRMAEAREEEEEKADLARARHEAIDALARGDGDANKIAKQAQKIVMQKAERRLGDIASAGSSYAADGVGVGRKGSLTIRGLKKKVAPVVEKPYDAFGGMDLTPTRYVLQDSYENEWLNGAVSDTRHMAGGYSLQEYYSRTMFEAFSGLGVFIEAEVAGRNGAKMETTTSARGADDVF
jgi:CDK-activating kinase assembly factor MAT1